MYHAHEYTYRKRSFQGGDSGRGGYRGGGGGRGGVGRFGNEPQPTEMQVTTNQYKFKTQRLLMNNNTDTSNYIQYEVKIKNVHRRRITDKVSGEATFAEEIHEIVNDDLVKFAKKPYAWRVMKKFVRDNGIVALAYDGNAKAYSRESVKEKLEMGKEYKVTVKRDCEEDDPDADRIKDITFAIEFQPTKKAFKYEDVMLVLGGEAASDKSSEEILTMINVILNSTLRMTKGMLSLETNSASVFFPLDMQQALLNGKANLQTRDGTKALLSGLELTVLTHKKEVSVQVESVVKYANKDYVEIFQAEQRHRAGATRVPLLDVNNRKIAGVTISDLARPIPDHSQSAIQEAIVKLGKINIEYRGTRRDQHRLYKNKECRNDNRKDDSCGRGQKIIFNPERDYTFASKDGQEITVAQHFLNAYGIKLQYPNMPIIFVDNISRHGGGWFPIEFAYQAFTKSKENSEDIVSNILKYHDNIAGIKYINEVEEKLRTLSGLGGGNGYTNFKQRLAVWGLEIDAQPVQHKAKILKAPKIKFGAPKIKFGNSHPVPPRNGSFNLNGVQFSRPAKLTSFGVVNFDKDNHTCYELVMTIMRVAESHGLVIPSVVMEISRSDRCLEYLSVNYTGRDAVDEALDVGQKAIQRAKNLYCYDSLGLYREKNVFFETTCFNEKQEQYECLVLPPDSKDDKVGLLLDYCPKNKRSHFFSHQITTHNGSQFKVRLMVKIDAAKYPIDPLDFRYHNGHHQACRKKDGLLYWENVKFDGYCYVDSNGTEFSARDIQSKHFVHFAENYEVDFPSIVFYCLPDDGRPLYNRIKVISNYFGGIQTQCAVVPNFKRQRNKDQYASNIATKINAKLSSIIDKAVSWTSTLDDVRGEFVGDDVIPWVGEKPTLVIGVGLVHGMGKFAKTVVTASVCLDSGCMRLSLSCFLQKKADTIADCVMKDIIKVSIKHYMIEQGHKPERILFYRDGMSDGNFVRAENEVAMIREAAEEDLGGTIPITFVICQSNIGFRMVPSTVAFDLKGKPMNNVGSGTYISDGDSFYLVAQGGMKGTSKPVKYIVSVNENSAPVDGMIGLTLENLIECTFHMAWKYPSATKAVREIPAIKYAKRLGNQVLSSLSCLEAGCNWFGKDMKLVCPNDDTGTEEERRPYLEARNAQGLEEKRYNLVEMPFRNHLAA